MIDNTVEEYDHIFIILLIFRVWPSPSESIPSTPRRSLYEGKEKIAPLEDRPKQAPTNSLSYASSYSTSFSSSITDGFNHDDSAKNTISLLSSQQKGKEPISFINTTTTTITTTSLSTQQSQLGVEATTGNGMISSNSSLSPHIANPKYAKGGAGSEWLAGSQRRLTRMREEYCQFYGCHRNVNDGSGDQYQHRCEQCNFVFCREVCQKEMSILFTSFHFLNFFNE